MEDEVSSFPVSVANHRRLELLKEDRISALPDTIIRRILSLLLTEHAIRTGVLSRRWKYLWTSLPILDFCWKDKDKRKSPCEQVDDFFDFIDKTLILHSSDKINELSLAFPVPEEYSMAKCESRLSFWLRFATVRKVEELHLELYTEPDKCYVIPDFLYDNSSLTKLFSSFCVYPLSRSGHVCWGLIKQLIISETKFEDDGVLQMILLGSPVLEHLELRVCRGVPDIDTASNTGLKRLVLHEVEGSGSNPEISISIPTVTSLEILGPCCKTQFELLNVSSLLDVTLDFRLDEEVPPTECCNQVWELLESVNHVKKLTVGQWCIQVLSISMPVCPILSKNNCTCLTISTRFQKWDFYGVAYLLDTSPNLEKLVVDSCRWSSQFYSFDYPIQDDFWSWQPVSFDCLQRLLKTIQILRLDPRNYFYDNACLLEFIKYLLRTAKVLEKLVILAPRDRRQKMHNYYSISQQLLSFPRASSQAVVLLPK